MYHDIIHLIFYCLFKAINLFLFIQLSLIINNLFILRFEQFFQINQYLIPLFILLILIFLNLNFIT